MNRKSMTNVKDLFIILITFAIILSIINVITEKTIFESNAKEEAIENAKNRMLEKEKLLKDFLEQSELTLKSLRQTELFEQYLKDSSLQSDMENIFLSYSKFQKSFMQLRFIDKQGKEKIRIDRNMIQYPHIALKKDLQNKSSRYYFYESKNKPLERVWFSALDLNIEKGQVEIPFKPTLRAMYPIKYNDKFYGILIINYLMEEFLEHLTDTPLYDTIIFNDKGHTLKHYKKDKSWGDYKDIKYNISDEYPMEYKNILDNTLYEGDDFISKKLTTPIYGGINIILKIKESYISKQENRTNLQYILITIISLASALILSIIIIKFFSKTLLNFEVINKLNHDLETASKIAKIGFWEYNNKIDAFKWNSGVYKIYDMDKKDTNLNLEKVLSHIHTDDRVKFQKLFKRSIKEKKEFHNIHRIITSNNDIKYIEEKAIHIFDKLNIYVKSIGSVVDITDLKEQEKQLYRAEKMASMGEMIGNIAHQWRQPLSVISTVSTSYQMKKELNVEINLDKLVSDMNMINDNAQYLSQTIDDFKNFIKGSSELKSFDLKNDTKQFLHLIESSIISHNIKVILDEMEEKTIVKGYPNELIQCFINIFNNAKDALKENDEDDRYIFISEKIEEEYVIIKFKDNARGIPSKVLPKIFDPYFTTKHQSQGTGIGLHMTYNLIVHGMGGKIEAKNVEYEFNGKNYKGAEFTISIPIKLDS